MLTRSLIIGLALSSPLLADTIVFYDDFQDQNRAGWYATESKPTFTTGVVNDATLGSYALQRKDTGSGGYAQTTMIASFVPQTLSQAGHKITLTFKFRMPTVPTNTRTFGFGLYNDNGSTQTADAQTSPKPSDNDKGYHGVIASGNNYGAGLYSELGTNLAIFGGSDRTQVSSVTGGRITNTGSYTATFSIERDVNGDLLITSSFANISNGNIVNSVAYTATSPVTYTYNEVVIGTPSLNNLPVEWIVDDVKVSSFVPEPASAVGLLTMGLFLLGRRSKR